MIISIIFILFVLLFLLPFLPGFIEMIRKVDADPLYISMDYIRNPRYFGKSFKKILHGATEGFTLGPGKHDVKLSKKEILEITPSLEISESGEINHLLYIRGNLVSGDHAQLNKEVYLTDNATIGPNNIIQALVADGNVTVAQGVRFQRWLDADGDIDIGENCILGISVSSGNKLSLSKNCLFRRLYGRPIATGDNLAGALNHLEGLSPPEEPEELLPEPLSFIRKKDRTVPPGTIETHNVVFQQAVRIGHGSIFRGSIKSYGRLVLEENVRVDGNVFADGDIIIGRNAKISGHVFSQMSIYISEQTLISHPDKIKSVIAKKGVQIKNNVMIYGYVTTEGEGMIG